MINSISLLGSSSGRNAGDAALIAGIIDSVDSAMNKNIRWEIPTIAPSYIRNNYRGVVQPISMLPWSGSIKMLGIPTYRSINRTDMSLIFDAILFDRQLYNPLFNYLSTVSLLLPPAKRRGKILGCFNVGVGPVNTPPGKEMLRKLCEEMDFITVRDTDSYNILREIGVVNPRVLVTADAALTMNPCSDARVDEILASIGFTRADQPLAINVSKYIDTWAGAGSTPLGREKFVELYSNALNQVIAQLKVPLLFVCTQVHDIPLTREIMSRIKSSEKVGIITNERYNHYDIRGVLGAVGLLFGMRLHATILASAGLTPVLGLPHQPKVTHYFRTLGLEDRILTFKSFSVESVRDHLLKGWSERSAIRARLETAIPVSRKKAVVAAELIAAISSGEKVESAIERLRPATLAQAA